MTTLPPPPTLLTVSRPPANSGPGPPVPLWSKADMARGKALCAVLRRSTSARSEQAPHPHPPPHLGGGGTTGLRPRKPSRALRTLRRLPLPPGEPPTHPAFFYYKRCATLRASLRSRGSLRTSNGWFSSYYPTLLRTGRSVPSSRPHHASGPLTHNPVTSSRGPAGHALGSRPLHGPPVTLYTTGPNHARRLMSRHPRPPSWSR